MSIIFFKSLIIVACIGKHSNTNIFLKCFKRYIISIQNITISKSLTSREKFFKWTVNVTRLMNSKVAKGNFAVPLTRLCNSELCFILFLLLNKEHAHMNTFIGVENYFTA